MREGGRDRGSYRREERQSNAHTLIGKLLSGQ